MQITIAMTIVVATRAFVFIILVSITIYIGYTEAAEKPVLIWGSAVIEYWVGTLYGCVLCGKISVKSVGTSATY